MSDTNPLIGTGFYQSTARRHRRQMWVEMFKRTGSLYSAHHDTNMRSRLIDDLTQTAGLPTESVQGPLATDGIEHTRNTCDDRKGEVLCKSKRGIPSKVGSLEYAAAKSKERSAAYHSRKAR